MPHPRKFYIARHPYLITSRIKQGLPLVRTSYMRLIIESVLARAARHYQIRVCHYVFMGNHFHMLVVALGAEDASRFVGYVKKELAEAVKQIQGRVSQSIWEEGYDSPILLTPETVMKYITYIYTNPQASNLVETIDEYPGVSSWNAYLSGEYNSEVPWVRRSMIPTIKSGSVCKIEDKRISKKMKQACKIKHRFRLEPDAWIECFPEYNGVDPSKVKRCIISRVREEEVRLSQLRIEQRVKVLGAERLSEQSILKRFHPKKWGKRMICLSDNIELRRKFLQMYRLLKERCEEVYQSWKLGEMREHMPAGMLAPRQPVLVSCLHAFE